jgi:hypothetical protein
LWASLLLATTSIIAGSAQAVEAVAVHKYTAAELRNYAQTLVAVTRIRQALAAQEAASPNADRSQLTSDAAARIAKVLDQHELTTAAFNAISARVETQPAVQRQVNQMVMDEVIRS